MRALPKPPVIAVLVIAAAFSLCKLAASTAHQGIGKIWPQSQEPKG